jgi:hypothetical protein
MPDLKDSDSKRVQDALFSCFFSPHWSIQHPESRGLDTVPASWLMGEADHQANSIAAVPQLRHLI